MDIGFGSAFWRHSGRKRFKRGMLKWVVLRILEQGERHGYDFINWFRDGGWAPGAGSIYPLLATLEEDGLIEGRDENGKRIYRITENGRRYLQEHAPFDDMREIFEERKERHDERGSAFGKLAAAFWQAQRTAAPESLEKISAILDRARKDIYSILADE